MSPEHRNRINCIDRHWEHRVHKRSRMRLGIRCGQVRRRKISNICFALQVDRPHSELMATVSSAAAAEMNSVVEQIVRTKYPQLFVVRGATFCERGQINFKNMLKVFKVNIPLTWKEWFRAKYLKN